MGPREVQHVSRAEAKTKAIPLVSDGRIFFQSKVSRVNGLDGIRCARDNLTFFPIVGMSLDRHSPTQWQSGSIHCRKIDGMTRSTRRGVGDSVRYKTQDLVPVAQRG